MKKYFVDIRNIECPLLHPSPSPLLNTKKYQKKDTDSAEAKNMPNIFAPTRRYEKRLTQGIQFNGSQIRCGY
jgi:hypothetical protein